MGNGYIYYSSHVPLFGTFFKSLRKAAMSFTIVDSEYELIDHLLKDRSFKIIIDIQDCSEEMKSKLISEGFKVNEIGTYLVDLSKTEDELWNNIKKETRKLIRRTSEFGCSVALCNSDAEFREYYKLFKKSRDRLNFKSPSYKTMKKQWDILHPETYHVFMVRDESNNLLAAMGILFSKEYMMEVAAARSEESRQKHIYANDLLKWEIIKWGHKNNIHYYDLAGVDPNPAPGSKEENIRRFKEKWGGQYHDWFFFEKYNLHTPLQKIFFQLESIHRRLYHKKESKEYNAK